MICRKLDGAFFRIKRDGKYQNICFSDMNTEEKLQVLNGKDIDFVKRLCLTMSEELRRLGDKFDFVRK